jgi:hypothetical protein
VYKEVWIKDKKYVKGSQISGNKDWEYGAYDNFKKRVNKLCKFGYIKQECIPNINPYEKGARTVIYLGEHGISALNETGEDVSSNPYNINPYAIKHELMVSNAHKRLHEDVVKLDQYVSSYYDIKNEHTIRSDNKGQTKGAVYPDLSLTITLIGRDTNTKEEVRVIRIAHVEIDGGSISPREYVEKIVALADSPIVKFEERLDKHVVYVLSNDRKRIDALVKVIRHNKSKIGNWERIGFAIYYDVLGHGFFPLFLPKANTIFLNCDNNEVDIIRKDEIG